MILIFVGSAIENFVYIFDKGLIFARNLAFCLRGWKFLRAQKSLDRAYFFSLKHSTWALLGNPYKKCEENFISSESIKKYSAYKSVAIAT